MQAAVLTGPRHLSLVDHPEPPAPQSGEVLIEVLSVGICGSDLHMYETGQIGGVDIGQSLCLGHEFSGRILESGPSAVSESGQALKPGMRVAVEPHLACGHCESCREGNPNLCPHHQFYGVAPTDGALRERMVVRAANCFPIPDEMSADAGALLEPLGVALHSVDLGRIRAGNTVAVIGCGCIGALIARLAVISGASRVFAFDRLTWRSEFVSSWAAEAFTVNTETSEAVETIARETAGRGVDVVFEAAWADQSVQQSIDMVREGGRVVMVGIPSDDRYQMRHSVARRKGLTIRMVRRMKHTYPRAIALSRGELPAVALDELVSDVYPLGETPRALRETADYKTNLLKAVVRPGLSKH